MSALIDQYSQHVVEEVKTIEPSRAVNIWTFGVINNLRVHLTFQVENSVGRCEPVSRAVNASIMAVCKEVVLPFVS